MAPGAGSSATTQTQALIVIRRGGFGGFLSQDCSDGMADVLDDDIERVANEVEAGRGEVSH